MAHGKTVKRYRELNIKGGQIGYAPNVEWNEPYSNRQEDIDACRRASVWFIEWFMDPVFKGEYPSFMTEWFREKEGVLFRF